MSIRQALRKQGNLASEPRGRKLRGAPERWCGSNLILALMTAVLVVICAVELLHG
jgi:hypothetical protein